MLYKFIPIDLNINMISCNELYIHNTTKGITKMIMTLIHNESP